MTLLQTDLEESKEQEVAKLQQALQDLKKEMQKKIDEKDELLVKERAAAQKAIEEVSSSVVENPVTVVDTAKIETLTAEVDRLKVILLQF